jgi:hypothetical protein
MRQLALLSVLCLLSGCGYKTWWNPPLTSGSNPNRPQATSENLNRVEGGQAAVEPITTEPGDIWPGPLQAPPTLEDLEKNGGVTPQAEQPVPGSPLSRGAPGLPPNPNVGSSTPPGNVPSRPLRIAPPTARTSPQPAAPSGGQAGQVVQAPSGTGVTTGGTSGYQTMTQPGGGQSIIVPNGNGTSTVIHSDGRVETIPSQR